MHQSTNHSFLDDRAFQSTIHNLNDLKYSSNIPASWYYCSCTYVSKDEYVAKIYALRHINNPARIKICGKSTSW